MVKYTKELLEAAVKNSTSLAGTLRYLGLKHAGGTQNYIKNIIKRFNINTSHFTGQGHNKGKILKRKSFTEILVNKPRFYKEKTKLLRRAMIESGIEYKCNICGISNWNNKNISLEIHHIDENNLNNIKTNLEFQCPNCHSQSDSYCKRKTLNKNTTNIDKVVLLKKVYLCSCGNKKSKNSIRCKKCDFIVRSNDNSKKKFIVSKEELSDLINKKISFIQLGKKFGVSDNAIRKRARKFNLI